MKANVAVAALLFAATVSCAPPIEHASSRVEHQSSVLLINAPEGAILTVGGRQDAAREGSVSVDVVDGWHDVTVVLDGRVVRTERVFLQDGSQKVIDFSAPK